jgi:hypothetical protein
MIVNFNTLEDMSIVVLDESGAEITRSAPFESEEAAQRWVEIIEYRASLGELEPAAIPEED